MKRFITALALAAFAAVAQAQVSTTSFFVFTNLPALVQTNTATALSPTTNYLTISQNSGLSVQGRFTVSNTNGAGTGNCGMWIRFSADGTNYPNPAIIVLAAANAATTTNVMATNFSAAFLSGFSTMTVNLTNSNEQMTNFGVIVSKWYPGR